MTNTLNFREGQFLKNNRVPSIEETEGSSAVYEFLCMTTFEGNSDLNAMIFRPLRPFCPQSCSCSNRRRANTGFYCPVLGDEVYEETILVIYQAV